MKGQMYTLEAAIAVIILLSFLIFLWRFPVTTTEDEKINYKLKLLNALKALDEANELRKDAINGNVSSLKSKLSSFVPAYLNFSITIFNETTNVTSKPKIQDSDVISVSYFISGDIGEFDPREIIVHLWGFE